MCNYLIFLQDILSPRERKLSFALSLTWCLTDSQCSAHTEGVGAPMLRLSQVFGEYYGHSKMLPNGNCASDFSSGLELLLCSSVREPIVILF